MKNVFLTLSVIIGLMAPLVGIYSMLKKKFRPQRMTRFLLVSLNFLFVGTLFAQGDRNAIYLASAILLSNLVVFVLSIKYGIGGTTKLDIFILFMTIFSLFIWQSTRNPVLGLVMSIITDFIAVIPTLVKTWVIPETEEWRFYIVDSISGFFNILSISVFTIGKLAFPLYVFFISSTLGLIIILRKKYLKIIN